MAKHKVNQKLKEHLRKILPRAIAQHRILAGPLRGHTLVTSWHDYPAAILGRTERPLLNWFQEYARQGETWLDVGAHFGYTALALSKLVGPQGRVFAFEPMVSTAGCLAQSRRFNGLAQLSVIPVALGQPESFGIHLLPATRGMVDSTITGSSWVEPISVARLDWLWPRICGENPKIDGIKVDVQGMELETLTGMRAVLQQFQPKLVIEIHKGVSRLNLLQCLAAVGYRYPGHPIEPLEDETKPCYLDDRSYSFRTTA
jgi:FkbM family methyltransferase